MSGKDPKAPHSGRGEKDCWHPYSLQSLTPLKFVKVVDKVLSGRYRLIILKSKR
jgi:hypothetical protein